MASGNIFKLLAEIKALKLDYEGAVKYLTDQGIEVVGIVKQGLDNFFKKIKARDPDFGNVVKELPIDDAGVPFNPNTLKSTPEKRGVENLFEETKKLPDVKMGSRINYQAIADKAGIDVELIRGKSWEEIMEIIKGKADGGRIGFKKGGKGRQDPMGGFAHQTAQEMREAAPDQFGGGMNISHGGNGDRGGGNKALVNNLNMSPVIESEYTGLGFPVPTGKVGIQTLTKLGKIQAMLDFKNLLEGEDLEPELTYENQIGPLHIGGKFDTEGNKALGLGFNQGNLSIGAYTDLDDVNNIGLRYHKTFKDGGRVGFVAGGWADDLTGQALATYNSMTSGGHSDETIQNTLRELGYWGGDGIQSIVNTESQILPQRDNVGNTSPIGVNVQNFYEATKPKPDQPPGKIQSFLTSGIDSLKQSKLGQMGASALGWLGDLPGVGMLGQLDQFDQLPYEDQEFITSQMGYSDPNTNQGNQDPFGINVRSAFGNYAAYVDKMFNQNIGKEWKPGSWQAQRKIFYDDLYQKKEQERILKELADEEAARRRGPPTTGQGGAIDPRDLRDIGGGFHEYTDSATAASYEGTHKDGGLATMFKRKR